jgi:hypothetical protein
MAREAETTRILLSIHDFLEGKSSDVIDVLKTSPQLAAVSSLATEHGLMDLMTPEGRRFIVAPHDLREEYTRLQNLPSFVRIPDYIPGTVEPFLFEIPANTRAFHTMNLKAMQGDPDSILSHLPEIFDALKQNNPDVPVGVFSDYYSHWAADMTGGLVYILPGLTPHADGDTE